MLSPSINQPVLSMMLPFGSPQAMNAYDPSGSHCSAQQQPLRRTKKSRLDYANSLCAVCNAPADGLHYGAISCRSCNAFFRRSVTYKQHFVCRKGDNCNVDVSVRCACRACRLAKCKLAGMRDSDVQPKRDPTGSQKNRRAPQRRRHAIFELGDGTTAVKAEAPASVSDCSPNTLLPSVESATTMERHYLMPEDNTYQLHQTLLSCSPQHLSTASNIAVLLAVDCSKRMPLLAQLNRAGQAAHRLPGRPCGHSIHQSIKRETAEHDDEEEEEVDVLQVDDDVIEQYQTMEPTSSSSASTSGAMPDRTETTADVSIGTQNATRRHHHLLVVPQQWHQTDPEQREFDDLVSYYREHLIWINRAVTPIDIESFLNEEHGDCIKWRPMEPTDLDVLSKIELSGLLYWIEKLSPFRQLPVKERTTLFKRYTVRKLSLDHFYTASKHPKLIADGNFAMPNNTYVSPDRTGFETTRDDEHTRKAKFHLRWSGSNNRFVDESTRHIMQERREWAVRRLFKHYASTGVEEPTVRLGEILLLLPELEVVCDMHCKDFQVAQLFEFCNMSEYWYENYAYSSLSIT
uniref:Nuclear receptor domain-containing protein n=1 Tax=Globodera pallida TaxID=36090 RepID=A0A183BZN2_GLOPA